MSQIRKKLEKQNTKNSALFFWCIIVHLSTLARFNFSNVTPKSCLFQGGCSLALPCRAHLPVGLMQPLGKRQQDASHDLQGIVDPQVKGCFNTPLEHTPKPLLTGYEGIPFMVD